ncbi:radical SAM protein [bacterium]|nr:radical SAM protein [bacterium]
MKLDKNNSETENTYCPRLWNGIFIDHRGNIYSYCRAVDVIGNIYRQNLKEVVNNDIIQKIRKKSLDGELACYQKCTLLKDKKTECSDRKLIIDYKDLERIKLLFGTKCNINCIMCRDDKCDPVMLDCDRLIKNLDITPFQKIEIQGGEPLFMEQAKEFFDHAVKKGKKVSFLTNGLLINDEWAKKIVLHSKSMYISINGSNKKIHEIVNKGSKWETVLAGIKRIQEAKQIYKNNFNLHGHMTIIEENLLDIPNFIKNFPDIGFDTISFGFDRDIPSYIASHPIKTRVLKWKIKRALKKSDILKVHKHRLEILRLT